MAEPYIGEVRLFPFAFAPRGWALCNGQLMPISQNQALFSILGTTYGGDGVTKFALPDLRGRVAVHTGSGVTLGQSAGEEGHALTTQEMPAHQHQLSANRTASTLSAAANNVWGPFPNRYAAASNATMASAALSSVGSGAPHPNLQPYLVASYCIALTGIFPSRN